MPPKVKVTVTAVLANYLGGKKEFLIEASNLRNVVEALAEQYGPEIKRRLLDEEGRLRRYINIYVNDAAVDARNLDIELKEGDEVLILPAVSGGASSRAARLLPALLAVGALIQIALGEIGARGWLLMAHALIGLAGLPMTAAAIYFGRSSRAGLVYASILLPIVLAQVVLGMMLIGWIPGGGGGSELVERLHRSNAYVLLGLGAVGGIIVGLVRRRARKLA